MDSRPILRRSLNTERALVLPRPRLRGVSHLIAASLWVPGGLLWVSRAEPGRDRVASGAFVVGIAAMFVCSALLHVRRWTATTHERLLRLDHSGIYLAIAGTGVAIALLGLTGWPQRLLLAAAICGGGLGILVEWLPFAPPRGFSNAVYLTLGWLPVVLLPWVVVTSGWVAIAWLVLGGALYTAGAVIVATRRPDPVPDVFGYHEVFHLLVILAALAHAWMLEGLRATAG